MMRSPDDEACTVDWPDASTASISSYKMYSDMCPNKLRMIDADVQLANISIDSAWRKSNDHVLC